MMPILVHGTMFCIVFLARIAIAWEKFSAAEHLRKGVSSGGGILSLKPLHPSRAKNQFPHALILTFVYSMMFCIGFRARKAKPWENVSAMEHLRKVLAAGATFCC